VFALGLGVTIPGLVVEVPNNIENIVEWNFCVLLHGNLALTGLAWRKTGVSLGMAFGSAAGPPLQPK